MIGSDPTTNDCEFGIAITQQMLTLDRPALHRTQPETTAGNLLERLVKIMNANERLMAELETARARIVRARDYLATPAANTRFGTQNLAHCKGHHRGVLTQIRANRIEANRILGLAGDEGRACS